MSGPTVQPHLQLCSSMQEIANNHREPRSPGHHARPQRLSARRGTPEAYEGLGIRYLGVEAHDSASLRHECPIEAAADFIHRALSQPGGVVGRRGARWRGWTHDTERAKPRALDVEKERELNDVIRCSGKKLFSQPSFSMQPRKKEIIPMSGEGKLPSREDYGRYILIVASLHISNFLTSLLLCLFCLVIRKYIYIFKI